MYSPPPPPAKRSGRVSWYVTSAKSDLDVGRNNLKVKTGQIQHLRYFPQTIARSGWMRAEWISKEAEQVAPLKRTQTRHSCGVMCVRVFTKPCYPLQFGFLFAVSHGRQTHTHTHLSVVVVTVVDFTPCCYQYVAVGIKHTHTHFIFYFFALCERSAPINSTADFAITKKVQPNFLKQRSKAHY